MLLKLSFLLRLSLPAALVLLAAISPAQTTIPVGPGQAHTTIQSGIDAANPGDTVLVAPGTYSENIDFKGKAITVTSSDGPSVTTIKSPNNVATVLFQTKETRKSVLSNFTITGGGQDTTNYDGGIYSYSSSPTILNNVITKTICYGIYSWYSNPLIQGNEISYTQAQGYTCSFAGGAGIWIDGGNILDGFSDGLYPEITGNTIENNTESGLGDSGGNGGGAIAVWTAVPTIIQNNIIRNNATGKYPSAADGGEGGGIFFSDWAAGLIANNLIYGNTSNIDGGGISFNGDDVDGSSLFVINNTIVDNAVVPTSNQSAQSVLGGEQLYFTAGLGSKITFANNIISGSTSSASVVCDDQTGGATVYDNDDFFNAGGPVTATPVGATGTCTYPDGANTGNTSEDPLFVAPPDYHLQLASSAVDSGSGPDLQLATNYGVTLSTDLEGKPRIQNGKAACIVDRGAYEYRGTVVNCGIGGVLTSSLNPADEGQSVTFTETLYVPEGTPAPIGSIQFLDGSTPLATQNLSTSGTASYTTNALSTGKHTIIAQYLPIGNITPTSNAIIQVINGEHTSATLTCNPSHISVGATIQLNAEVTSSFGTPTGSVNFDANSGFLATVPLTNGSAAFTYTSTFAGLFSLSAGYMPSGAFAPTSASCDEIVDSIPTTSTLTVTPTAISYGQSIQLEAAVASSKPSGAGAPTGTITFLNGSTALGTATLANGAATLTTNSLSAGAEAITCTYSGSSIYASSQCNAVPVTIARAATALTLTSTRNPSPYAAGFTLTAQLTHNGQSAGAGDPIQLIINGQTTTLTTDDSGSATATFNTLDAGTYPATATYPGNTNLLPSSAVLTETITADQTSTTLTASPRPGNQGQPVTLTATVSSTPTATGTATFYDGTIALGTSTLNAGTATLITSFATLGTHNLTARYNGTVNLTPSTSAVFQEPIIPGDFSIAATPTAATLYTGQSTTATVTLTALNGFNQAVELSCGKLPANTTCTFMPAAITTGQGTASLVIQSSAPAKSATSAASIAATPAGLLAAAVTLLLLPGGRARRRILVRLSVLLMAVAALTGVTACGAPAPISGGTPPGSYAIAITGSALAETPALTHSATFNLTVKSLF